MRASAAAVGVQGLRRLLDLRASAAAVRVQGLRRRLDLRASAGAVEVQGLRRLLDLRASAGAAGVQGLRRRLNLRASAGAVEVQGVRRRCGLRAPASAVEVQGLWQCSCRTGLTGRCLVAEPAGCGVFKGEQHKTPTYDLDRTWCPVQIHSKSCLMAVERQQRGRQHHQFIIRAYLTTFRPISDSGAYLPQIVGFGSSGSAFGHPARVQQRL